MKLKDIELKYSTKLHLNRKTRNNPTSEEEGIKEMKREEEPYGEDIFDTDNIDRLEEQNKVDLTFDPVTRRSRVSLIARLFSFSLDKALEDMKAQLKKDLDFVKEMSDKKQLQDSLDRADRAAALKWITPAKIFRDILATLKAYVEASDEDIINEELRDINKRLRKSTEYTEEQKLEKAKKMAMHKRREYQKIIDCFAGLAEEACSFINKYEKIRIDMNTVVPEQVEDEVDVDEEGNTDEKDVEEMPKEGWLINDWETSAFSTLSDKVRKIVMKVPMLEKNKNGRWVYSKDDLGFTKYFDPSYVVAVLLDKTVNVTRPEDLIPALERAAKSMPWIRQVVKKAREDENVFTLLYTDLRKDFNNYWIQKKRTMANGAVKTETISINKPEGIFWLLDRWRDNYENGIRLDADSIYDEKGQIIAENAKKGYEIWNEFYTLLRNKDNKETSDILEKNWKKVKKMLNMIGIDMDDSSMKVALLTVPEAGEVKMEHPFRQIMPHLNAIFHKLGMGGSDIGQEDSEGTRKDLINEWGTVYTNIAIVLSSVLEDVIESSVRENGKSYYAHVKPGYLGTLIKELKDLSGDKERFDRFIEENFKRYDWFYDQKNKRWRNDWLRNLVEGSEKQTRTMKDGLDTKVLLNIDKAEYSDWDSLEYLVAMLNEYKSVPGKGTVQWAWYHVPIMSNAPVSEFIKFRKYTDDTEFGKSFVDIIIDKLLDLVEQEYRRILLVEARDRARQEGTKGMELMGNYDIMRDNDGNIVDIGGAEFKFLPALNTLMVKDSSGNDVTFLDMLRNMANANEINGDEIREFIRNSLSVIMEQGFNESVEKWKKLGLFDKTEDGRTYKYLNREKEEYAMEDLMEYYYNSVLATSQIYQLTITDLAYYDGMEAVQKRYKEIYSPGTKLNTLATWKGERVGKEIERFIVLQDAIVDSDIRGEIEKIVKEKVESGQLTRAAGNDIINAYRETNMTDGQALRTPKSYREVMIMAGEWDEDMEDAYNHFREGNWTAKDFDVVWQTRKPFLYSQVPKDDGFGGKIKMGIQHKNSEFLILAALAIARSQNDSKLAALSDYMEKNDIDVAQFESASKISNQGVMDVSNVEASDMEEYLDSIIYTVDENGNRIENGNIVHQAYYADYGTQTPTPEHGVDSTVLLGTQLMKLITSDMDDNAVYDVNGRKMTKKEFIDTWNALLAEDRLQAYKKVLEIFGNPEELERELMREIKGNPRYGRELMKACTIDKKSGKFVLPLCDSIQSNQLQTLLNSIIKNRVSKIKVHGGAFILASNFGFSDNLHVVMETVDGKPKVKYIECMMPAYSRDFFEPLMNEDGVLDLDRLDKYCSKEDAELLKRLIGWRTPTEGYYSMAPLRIKGFLPQQNGSAIVLPAEITTMSDSDFDIDKLYVFLHAFRKVEYTDWGAFRKLVLQNEGFRKWNKKSGGNALQIVINEIQNGEIEFSDDTPEKHLFDYYQKIKKDITKTRFEVEKYDWNKPMWENSREARENLMLDMIFSILTNSSSSSKLLSPGGFSENKRVASIATILDNVDDEELLGLLKEEGIIKDNDNINTAIEALVSLDSKTLARFAKAKKKPYDPLSPMTQVELHQANMTGSNLVGIYASHNPFHSLLQQTGLRLKDSSSFTINGKRLTSLHEADERISKTMASFKSAATDSAKSNTLAPMNQNMMTADVTMLLAHLGYSTLEIGLVMNQPIVKDIVQTYFRNKRSGMSKNDAMEKVIGKYKKKAAELDIGTPYEPHKDIEDMDFTTRDLVMNLLLKEKGRNLDDIHRASSSDERYWYDNQVLIGYLFSRMMADADALSMVMQASKADTIRGAAGPTIADTELKVGKVEDLYDAMERPSFPLEGAGLVMERLGMDNGEELGIDELRKKILDSPIPLVQAAYSLGVEASLRLMGRYFPHFTVGFRNVIRRLKVLSKYGRLDAKTMNSIYNDLMAYIMSSTEFFGAEGGYSSKQKRDAFIRKFPEYFERTLKENPKIGEIPFIKRLKVRKPNKYNPVSTVVFKNVGMLDTSLKESFSRDWESLLYMEDKKANEFAMNLFRYCFYRNGFAFGPSTFIHLAPVAVRLATPEYKETLEKMMDSVDTYDEFVEQYVRNHLNNRKLVPEVPAGGSVSFLDENRDIKDTVTFDFRESYDAQDKKVIKRTERTNNGFVYTFMDYIARREKGQIVYYRLNDSESTGTVATYERIMPLGYPNSFLEYEYGVSAQEVESVIKGEKGCRTDGIICR